MSIDQLWGNGIDLTVLQMSIRGLVIFWICYLLLRIGGKRIFGKKSAFDYVIIIVLGSILARVVVGATPFLPAVSSALAMALMNRLLAKLCAKFPNLNSWFNGEAIILYAGDKVIWDNLRKASLSFAELKESLRLELKTEDMASVQSAQLENNGRISFILKKEQQQKEPEKE